MLKIHTKPVCIDPIIFSLSISQALFLFLSKEDTTHTKSIIRVFDIANPQLKDAVFQ